LRRDRQGGSTRSYMQESSTVGKFHGSPSRMLTRNGLHSAFDGRVRRAYSSYYLRLCLPAAPVLPISLSEDFGTSSFCEQLSDKLNSLPMCVTYSV
jgi:hypothetical protein